MPVFLAWVLVLSLLAHSYAFFPFGRSYLVKIDGVSYGKREFLWWWKGWREEGMPFPETPDPFVDWILLSDEAKRMDLDRSPSYKKRLAVFLKVRSLMMLKKEEVDDKIRITRAELWKLYSREFVPKYRLKGFVSENETELRELKSEVKSSKDCERIFEEFPSKRKVDFGWQRPRTLPAYLKKALENRTREVLGPFKEGNRWVLVCVLGREDATPKDFERLIPVLADILRKKKEAELTSRLVERLKKKYEVFVDWDVIKRVSLKEPLSDDLKGKVVIRVEDKFLTAERFREYLTRDARMRYPGRELGREQEEELKRIIVNTILAQTLTEIEALSRHYEKREPLKGLWWFYRRQALIKELEEKVIWPQVKVSEEEVREYYESHKADYTKPEVVVIAVIRSKDERLVRETFEKIRRGMDFFDAAKELFYHGVHKERYAVNQLVPEMREVLEGLQPGDVSGVVKIGDYFCIVKLVDRIPEAPHSFELVKESIRELLRRKKFLELKERYVAMLREKSEVEVNWKVWKSIRKEFGA